MSELLHIFLGSVSLIIAFVLITIKRELKDQERIGIYFDRVPFKVDH